VDLRSGTKRFVLKSTWTTSSEFVNKSRFKSQHNSGDLYDNLRAMRNFHFNNEQDIHMSSKNYENNGYGLDSDLLNTSYKSHA
jgi:hypothetical protein